MNLLVVTSAACFTCGDLEYLNTFQGQVRWNSAFPCALCDISLEQVSNFQSVTDLAADPWEPLPRHDQRRPLFHRALSPMPICPDYMHSMHLGTDQRLLGSVAWVLIFDPQKEGPLEQRLFQLSEEMKEFRISINISLLWKNMVVFPGILVIFRCFLFFLSSKARWSEHKLSGGLSKLTLGFLAYHHFILFLENAWKMFLFYCHVMQEWSSTRMKRAPTKSFQSSNQRLMKQLFLFSLSKVWKKKMTENDKVHQWINLCLLNSCWMDEISRNRKDEWKLPAAEARELESAALKMMVCNFALCEHFASKGKPLFQANTFKHHWLLHTVKLAMYINPLHVDCYAGESFMRTMKTLMHAQLAGRKSLSSMYVMALTFETVNANDKRTWKLKWEDKKSLENVKITDCTFVVVMNPWFVTLSLIQVWFYVGLNKIWCKFFPLNLMRHGFLKIRTCDSVSFILVLAISAWRCLMYFLQNYNGIYLNWRLLFTAQTSSFLFSRAMDLQPTGERIKVLPHVTVHALETATEKGLKQAVWLH